MLLTERTTNKTVTLQKKKKQKTGRLKFSEKK